jgi:hypothetical protein
MTTAPTDQPIPTYLRGYDPSCISLLNNFGEVLMTNGFMMLPYEINHLDFFIIMIPLRGKCSLRFLHNLREQILQKTSEASLV